MADRNSALYTAKFVTKPPSKGSVTSDSGRIRIASDVCAPGVAPVNADLWLFGCVIPKGARFMGDGRWRSIGFATGGTSPGMDLKFRRLDTSVDSTLVTSVAAAVGTTTYVTHSVLFTALDQTNVPAGGYIFPADSVPVILWSLGGGLPTGTAGLLELELYYTLD